MPSRLTYIKSVTECPVDFTDWQHPYVNIFKHLKVDEWKKAAKEGDVTIYMVALYTAHGIQSASCLFSIVLYYTSTFYTYAFSGTLFQSISSDCLPWLLPGYLFKNVLSLICNIKDIKDKITSSLSFSFCSHFLFSFFLPLLLIVSPSFIYDTVEV